MDEVSRPIIGVACALLAVYVPVVFLGGIVGQLYRQFALTLCFAAIIVHHGGPDPHPGLMRHDLASQKRQPGPLGAFNRGFNRLFDRTTAGYLGGVKFFMRRLALALILLAAVFLGAGSSPADLARRLGAR